MFGVNRVKTQKDRLVLEGTRGRERAEVIAQTEACIDFDGNLFLEGIWVDEEEAGRGLGTALLGHAERWGRKKGANELTGIYAPEGGREKPTERFYVKNGVQIVEGMLRKKL